MEDVPRMVPDMHAVATEISRAFEASNAPRPTETKVEQVS
jgi:hypothetical protein